MSDRKSEATEGEGPRRDPQPGGASTIDQMSEGSFPASDPPAVWTWETPPATPVAATGSGPGPAGEDSPQARP